MKPARITSVLLVAGALLLPASVAYGSGSTTHFKAEVRDVAVLVTYTGTTAETNFEFDVYGCPAGQIINIAWEAEQPQPATSTAGEGTFVFSTGEPVQHLLVTTIGGFRPDYDWVGSGVVTCGALTTAVSGDGVTVPVGGGGGGGGGGEDDD